MCRPISECPALKGAISLAPVELNPNCKAAPDSPEFMHNAICLLTFLLLKFN